MCLIVLAWRRHPRWRLVVAANRDEFHARPTQAAARWTEGGVVAGRDLVAGGTWLGVTPGGRFAALTNVREPGVPRRPDAPSRGELVRGFLLGDASPTAYVDALDGGAYAGFNLLVSDGEALVWTSNRGGRRALDPGVYGVSNGLLDTPWPKVSTGKRALSAALDAAEPEDEALFALLADRSAPPDAALPDTGVGLDLERRLAPRFLLGEAYGTRCSTVVWLDAQGGCRFTERSFDPAGAVTGTQRFDWARP